VSNVADRPLLQLRIASSAVVAGQGFFLDLKKTAFAIKPKATGCDSYWQVCGSIIGLNGGAKRAGLAGILGG